MSNFFVCYLSIYIVCEDRLIYYHLGIIFLGPFSIIAILLDLGIIGQAMSGWHDVIHLGGNHSKFFIVGAVPIGDVREGVNLEV